MLKWLPGWMNKPTNFSTLVDQGVIEFIPGQNLKRQAHRVPKQPNIGPNEYQDDNSNS